MSAYPAPSREPRHRRHHHMKGIGWVSSIPARISQRTDDVDVPDERARPPVREHEATPAPLRRSSAPLPCAVQARLRAVVDRVAGARERRLRSAHCAPRDCRPRPGARRATARWPGAPRGVATRNGARGGRPRGPDRGARRGATTTRSGDETRRNGQGASRFPAASSRDAEAQVGHPGE